MTAPLRCAIYTRKSSEEGLEQDFNSLHAQREACEAYVRSQKGEGWKLLATTYDDAAYSGGSMERPALKQLLADIAAGKVDVVVVYKVDRLTRSLTDFAKIVEIFDKRGVSFVSVTQAFNTTTSMGRLTLNVLLSFAQFEREVTGERIRDKIAASKARGMWMGGMIPLGYDASGRTLTINAAEAEVVRHIFQRYLEVPSAGIMVAELAEQGVRSKAWVTRAGKAKGGLVMRRGALFHILSSRIYVGEIVHKDRIYPGQHPAIVSKELFAAAAEKLRSNAVQRRQRATRTSACALTGRIFNGEGQPFTPTFAYGKGGRRYRYYVASALQTGDAVARDCRGLHRLSASLVERFILEKLQRIVGRTLDLEDLPGVLARVETTRDETQLLVWVDVAFGSRHPDFGLEDVRRRLSSNEQAVLESGLPAAIRVIIRETLPTRGGARSVVSNGVNAQTNPNLRLIGALRAAHANLLALKASLFTPPAEVIFAVSPLTHHDRRMSLLAFLAPEIQRRIVLGEDQVLRDHRRLLRDQPPIAWVDQLKWLEAGA